jgi:hypothetical protein
MSLQVRTAIILLAVILSGCSGSPGSTVLPDSTRIASTAIPPTSTAAPEPAQEETAPTTEAQSNLAQKGPWVLFSAENGLWAMNADGTGLTRLTRQPILAPADLKSAVSQKGPYVAFVTADDPVTLQGLKLNLLKLPEGSLQVITPLSSAGTEPQDDAKACDPKFEAARAVTIGNGLQWSPDGSKLAFIGSMEGTSADVYVYWVTNGEIVRLSKDAGQAYDIHWAGDSQSLVYFEASCFGTGAGFKMEGAWAAGFDRPEPIRVYQPGDESLGETFITWLFNDWNAFFVATVSGCPLRDLRLVYIDTLSVRPFIDGCFEDVAVGPSNMLAVLTSSDFSDKPGLYLYGDPRLDQPPVIFSEANGRGVRESAGLFLVKVRGESGMEIRSVDSSGKPGWYQGKGDFPAMTRGGDLWAWQEDGSFYLSGKDISPPVILNHGNVAYPFWYEELSQTGEVHQRLLYFAGEGGSMKIYLASDPGYQPVLLAEGLDPVAPPVLVGP